MISKKYSIYGGRYLGYGHCWGYYIDEFFKYHRLDGPAKIYNGDTQEWYIHGVRWDEIFPM